ncbi:MAG: YceI family protein [Gammaproteobacteria bacterium]
MFKRSLLALALASASAAAFAAPVTFVLDPDHTNVVASWNHLGFSNPVAHFGEVDGTLVYDDADVGASSVTVTLPLTGMDGHVDAFNEHLRSADLFDADQYPQITFRSTRVEATGPDRLKVTGDLTIKGITREVVLDTRLNGRGEHPMAKREAIGFDATTTVKRSEFGLGYALPAVGDTVQLRITTEALVPAE